MQHVINACFQYPIISNEGTFNGIVKKYEFENSKNQTKLCDERLIHVTLYSKAKITDHANLIVITGQC